MMLRSAPISADSAVGAPEMGSVTQTADRCDADSYCPVSRSQSLMWRSIAATVAGCHDDERSSASAASGSRGSSSGAVPDGSPELAQAGVPGRPGRSVRCRRGRRRGCARRAGGRAVAGRAGRCGRRAGRCAAGPSRCSRACAPRTQSLGCRWAGSCRASSRTRSRRLWPRPPQPRRCPRCRSLPARAGCAGMSTNTASPSLHRRSRRPLFDRRLDGQPGRPAVADSATAITRSAAAASPRAAKQATADR